MTAALLTAKAKKQRKDKAKRERGGGRERDREREREREREKERERERERERGGREDNNVKPTNQPKNYRRHAPECLRTNIFQTFKIMIVIT